MFAVHKAIPLDGSLLLTLGSAPADIEVSPSHPLGQGQVQLQLTLQHGRISDLRMVLGAGHRGDEKLFEVRDYRQGLSLINRHNWLTPIAAEIAYAEACEELMGLTPPPRALALRSVVLALQNITGLLQMLAGVDDARRWLTQREIFVALTESITGARLHVSFVRLGGVAEAVAPTIIDNLRSELARLEIEADTHTPLRPLTVALRDAVTVGIRACAEAQQTDGAIAVALPKVVRVPVGQAYREVDATTGKVGVWLHSDGGKTPLRVGLRAPSVVAVSHWEKQSVGSTLDDALTTLLLTPLCIGEIER